MCVKLMSATVTTNTQLQKAIRVIRIILQVGIHPIYLGEACQNKDRLHDQLHEDSDVNCTNHFFFKFRVEVHTCHKRATEQHSYKISRYRSIQTCHDAEECRTGQKEDKQSICITKDLYRYIDNTVQYQTCGMNEKTERLWLHPCAKKLYILHSARKIRHIL